MTANSRQKSTSQAKIYKLCFKKYQNSAECSIKQGLSMQESIGIQNRYGRAQTSMKCMPETKENEGGWNIYNSGYIMLCLISKKENIFFSFRLLNLSSYVSFTKSKRTKRKMKKNLILWSRKNHNNKMPVCVAHFNIIIIIKISLSKI